MSLLQHILGNATEITPEQAATDFQPVLIDGEEIYKAFKLHRDIFLFTSFRVLTLDKQGVTGKKQQLLSIPYKSITKFSRESAGFMDLDAELQIWITGEQHPLKFEFSKGANINDAYRLLSHLVLAS